MTIWRTSPLRTPPSKKVMGCKSNKKDTSVPPQQHQSRRVSFETKYARSSLSKREFERFLRHKQAVRMNNYGIALLKKTQDQSVELAIKSLKDAIDAMLLVHRPPNSDDPGRELATVKALRDSSNESSLCELTTIHFEQLAIHEDNDSSSSSQQSPLWEELFTPLRMPRRRYPVGHSQIDEDASSILLNLSVAFHLLAAKSGREKWAHQAVGAYELSRRLARRAKYPRK